MATNQRNQDGPKCRDCGSTTERVGTFSLCANTYCDRHAIPVDDDGRTEQEVDRLAGASSQADGSPFSSEAMAATQRIGH
jgi:hypothetical protein